MSGTHVLQCLRPGLDPNIHRRKMLAVAKYSVGRDDPLENDAWGEVLRFRSMEGLLDHPGEHRGRGIVSLFHIGADSRWSDLPMSGSFVEMLRRLVDMSGYTSKPGAGVGVRPLGQPMTLEVLLTEGVANG